VDNDLVDMTEPDIRFSLANERTFLAWVRTAIGLVAAGVAIFHLFDESVATTVLSLVLLAAGALAGFAGYSHFRSADQAIRHGEALPTNTAVIAVMTGAVLLAVVAGVASLFLPCPPSSASTSVPPSPKRHSSTSSTVRSSRQQATPRRCRRPRAPATCSTGSRPVSRR